MTYFTLKEWWSAATELGDVYVDLNSITCYYPYTEEKVGEYDTLTNIGWLNYKEEPIMNAETINIDPSLIAGYILLRSPTDKFKFNVYATDRDNELLFCAASDLTFEKASAMVEVVNQEYYPVAPTPTEAVFIEIGGESKVYNITAK